MIRRLFSCFGRRGDDNASSLGHFEPQQSDVDRVLDSVTWHEALRLNPAASSTAGSGGDIEDARGGLVSNDGLTDRSVAEAFVCVGVQVHPYRNTSADAPLALRWVASAFTSLGDEQSRAQAVYVNCFEPLRQRECPTSLDTALRTFGEVCLSVYDRLSLHNLPRSGINARVAEALLRGVHMLYLQPHVRDQPGDEERSFLDGVLDGTLSANRLVGSVSHWFSSDRRQREQIEWMSSTTVAALGVVAFNGAARLQRMLHDHGAHGPRLPDANAAALPLGIVQPLVSCPLCRVLSPAGKAINNVHAGDRMPPCCVCTEESSNVCLPCGHVCLCQHCFLQLPRTTAAAA